MIDKRQDSGGCHGADGDQSAYMSVVCVGLRNNVYETGKPVPDKVYQVTPPPILNDQHFAPMLVLIRYTVNKRADRLVKPVGVESMLRKTAS